MNRIISGLVVASFTIIAASSALACDPMHKGQPCASMHKGQPCAGSGGGMDANKDGVISKKEFIAFHSRRFNELDANHDGKLSPQELGGAAPVMGGVGMGGHLEAADTNHDGALTREEAKGMPMLLEHFDEIDANKDGKITPDEMRSTMQEHRMERIGGSADKVPEKK